MTDRHPVYVGHFAHDGRFARYEVAPGTGLARPVVMQKIHMQTVREIAREYGIDLNDPSSPVLFENDYLVIDLASAGLTATTFIRAVVGRLNCDVVGTAMRVMSAIELSEEGA